MHRKRIVRAALTGLVVLAPMSVLRLNAQFNVAEFKDLSCVAAETKAITTTADKAKKTGGWGRLPALTNPLGDIGKALGLPEIAKEISGSADALVDSLVAGAGESAVCMSRTQEELVLLTGMMIDKSALSAAEGLDAVAAALNVARPLKEAIAARKRAATGFTPSPLSDTEAFVREITAAEVQLKADIESRKDAILKDPDIQRNLAEAHKSLAEVSYYGASASVGGTLFGRFFSDNPSPKQLFAMLESPRVGLGSDFARQLTDRGVRIMATLSGAVAIRAKLSEVKADPEDGANAATERARADAKSTAERIRKELGAQAVTKRTNAPKAS